MRKFLIPTLATALVMGLVIAGTWAWFSDTETASGNTFTAGTLELKIRDQDQELGDGVTATWTASNMKPGDTFAFGVPYVDLKHEGTIQGHHVEITCDYTITEIQVESGVPGTSADALAKQMVITRLEYYNSVWRIYLLNGTSVGSPPVPSGYVAGDWEVSDFDDDGRETFYDLKNDLLDNLPPPLIGPDGRTHLVLSVKFHEDAGNDFQGDTFNLTMFFTLNQDASQ